MMRSRRVLSTVLLIALAIALAAACDDAPAREPTPSAATARPTATPPAVTATVGTPATSTPVPTPTRAPASDDDLRRAAARYAGAAFTATYTIFADRSPDGFGSGTIVVTRDGDRLRLDVIAQQGDGTFAGLFIEAPPVRGFCLHQAADLGPLLGVDPMAGVCFAAGVGAPSGLIAEFAGIGALAGTARGAERQTIAGAGAICGDFGADARLRLCFAEDGALLSYSDAAGLAIVATEARPGADAAAFTFP